MSPEEIKQTEEFSCQGQIVKRRFIELIFKLRSHVVRGIWTGLHYISVQVRNDAVLSGAPEQMAPVQIRLRSGTAVIEAILLQEMAHAV